VFLSEIATMAEIVDRTGASVVQIVANRQEHSADPGHQRKGHT